MCVDRCDLLRGVLQAGLALVCRELNSMTMRAPRKNGKKAPDIYNMNSRYRQPEKSLMPVVGVEPTLPL